MASGHRGWKRAYHELHIYRNPVVYDSSYTPTIKTIKINSPKTKQWSYSKRPMAPKFDARDLIRRWKDYEWATDIQLEKIGVYALGSKEKLPGGGYRLKQMTEIDSIALPQSHVMDNPTELAEPKESAK